MRETIRIITSIILSIVLIGILHPMTGYGERSVEPDRSNVFAAKTIIVAQDGTGDHSTIQDGVDAASDGDTVKVYDGTYYEAVNIMKSVTLIGNGTTKTILDGKGTLDHQHLFGF